MLAQVGTNRSRWDTRIGIDIENMCAPWRNHRQTDGLPWLPLPRCPRQVSLLEELVIAGSSGLTGGDPTIQVPQLHAQHCRLYLIETAIYANQIVAVFAQAAMRA